MSSRIDARKMERLEEHYKLIKDRENFRTRNIGMWKYISNVSLVILIFDCLFLSYFLFTGGLSSLFIISLNAPFISLVIYILFILIAYVSKYKRRFYSSEVALTLEEVLFLRFLELYKKANRVSKEKEGIMRKKYKKELVNKFESIKEIVKSYGSINMSLINGIIGDEIDKFKLNFDEYLYSNIIMGDESDLNNVCRFLLDISEYMLNPKLDSLERINKQIQEWLDPKDYETDWVAKIHIFAYERPLTSRLIFSSIFILLTILIGLYLHLDVPYLYSGFFASAIVSFKIFDLIFKEDSRPTLPTSPDISRSQNSQVVSEIEEIGIPEELDQRHFKWHLSGAVMSGAYGKIDIPGSDSASELIVHQLEGEVKVRIVCDMRGLKALSGYKLDVCKEYALNSPHWPGRFSDTISKKTKFTTDIDGCGKEEFNLRLEDFSNRPGVHILSVFLNIVDGNTILISDNFEVSISP